MVDKEDSASLPPADVQRPTPPLTEAELAEMEQFRGVCGYLPDYWKGGPRTTDRLFATIHAKDADLRASRERIKELEAEVEEWKQAHRSEVGY